MPGLLARPAVPSTPEAYRLYKLILYGPLDAVLDDLRRGEWSPPSTPSYRSRTQALAPATINTLIPDGRTLLAAASTAQGRDLAFRVAVFCMLLSRGANPFARGGDGRTCDEVWEGMYKDPDGAERQIFRDELDRAKELWLRGEMYSEPGDVYDWINEEFEVLAEERNKAAAQAMFERDVVASPEPMSAVSTRQRDEDVVEDPRLKKRARIVEEPLMDYEETERDSPVDKKPLIDVPLHAFQAAPAQPHPPPPQQQYQKRVVPPPPPPPPPPAPAPAAAAPPPQPVTAMSRLPPPPKALPPAAPAPSAVSRLPPPPRRPAQVSPPPSALAAASPAGETAQPVPVIPSRNRLPPAKPQAAPPAPAAASQAPLKIDTSVPRSLPVNAAVETSFAQPVPGPSRNRLPPKATAATPAAQSPMTTSNGPVLPTTVAAPAQPVQPAKATLLPGQQRTPQLSPQLAQQEATNSASPIPAPPGPSRLRLPPKRPAADQPAAPSAPPTIPPTSSALPPVSTSLPTPSSATTPSSIPQPSPAVLSRAVVVDDPVPIAPAARPAAAVGTSLPTATATATGVAAGAIPVDPSRASSSSSLTPLPESRPPSAAPADMRASTSATQDPSGHGQEKQRASSSLTPISSSRPSSSASIAPPLPAAGTAAPAKLVKKSRLPASYVKKKKHGVAVTGAAASSLGQEGSPGRSTASPAAAGGDAVVKERTEGADSATVSGRSESRTEEGKKQVEDKVEETAQAETKQGAASGTAGNEQDKVARPAEEHTNASPPSSAVPPQAGSTAASAKPTSPKMLRIPSSGPLPTKTSHQQQQSSPPRVPQPLPNPLTAGVVGSNIFPTVPSSASNNPSTRLPSIDTSVPHRINSVTATPRPPSALPFSPPTEPRADREARLMNASTGKATSPTGPRPTASTGTGANASPLKARRRSIPRASPVTMELHRLPQWMNEALVRHWLDHGPDTFAKANERELPFLEDLIELDSFKPLEGAVPPIPMKVELSGTMPQGTPVAEGYLIGRVTYASKALADRAKEMFDGKKVAGCDKGLGVQWKEVGGEIEAFRAANAAAR